MEKALISFLVFFACWSLTVTGVHAASPIIFINTSPISVAEDTALESQIPGASCTTSDADAFNTDAGTYYVSFNGGNGDRRFVTAGRNCAMYLIQALDAETTPSYTLGFRAQDLLNEFALTSLQVDVQDANDNAPSCTPVNVVVSLAENVGANTQVTDLSAICSDPDTGMGGQINYQPKSGDLAVLTVDGTSGIVTTVAALDYATAQSHTLVVEVFDLGTPQLTGTVTVYLDVTAVDNNVPTFDSSSPYTFNIDENTAVGTTLFNLPTTDLDQADTDNSKVTYGFESGPTPDWIGIDPSTGDVIVKDTMDYETSTSITCQVFAYSSNQASSKSLIDVTINLNDLNDNAPVFQQSFYEATIAENSAFGTLVISVTATDADASDTIEYSLSGTTEFDIVDSTVGNVTVRSVPDYETTTAYLVTLTATDNGAGTLASSVYLRITVDPVNEAPPVFTTGISFTVSEDTVPGTSVFQVNADDADSGTDGEVLYTIVTGGPDFAVDSDTGIIRVAVALDYETQTSYTLVVRATDQSATVPRSVEQTITVVVIDVDDVSLPCDPVNTQVIPDPNSLNYVVATLSCTDVDLPTDPITYSILLGMAIPGGAYTTIFTMDGANLVLSTYPANTRYLVQIEATDGVSSTTVEFTVLTETRFELDPLMNLSIEEGGSVGAVLSNVTWTDVFPFARAVITSGNDDNKVVLYSTAGQLVLMSPYDRETTGTYSYAIQASTSSNQVAAGTLTVTVDDVNDNAPAFGSSIYFVTLSESLAPPATVDTYTATDLDTSAFGPITYSIASGNALSHFTLNANTGVLDLANNLDFESTPSYTLVLYAVDGGMSTGLTGSTTVEITVQNADDEGPAVIVLIPSTMAMNLAEDNALGSTVIRIQATDPDDDIEFTYSIDSGNTDNDFGIDPKTGIVRQIRLLDRERTSSYTLVLAATDQNNVKSTATLTITVTDVNDNDPAFSLPVYEFDVPHNTGPGVKVGDVSVSDLDDGANAVTTVVIDDGSVTGIFTLTYPEIFTATTMDYETVRTYNFKVKVTDSGTPTRSATARVVVNVLPSVNEPKFDPTAATVSIPEGTLIGHQVYDLDATVLGTSETDGTMQYIIQSETPAGGFTVLSDTGQVVTLVTMDYETSTQYVLVIRACIALSCAANYDEFTLTININDLNDNTPYFTQGSYTFQVEETEAVNTVVGTVGASDDDSPNHGFSDLTYTLTGTSNDFALVSSTSGVIQVSTSLNYQTQNVYTYLLTASDGGTPANSAQVSVVIQVKDTNTNDPVFTTATSTSVLDSSPVGSEVFHFHATDADTGVAGEITYGIVSDSSGGAFSLDPNTGILTTTQALDALVVPSYTLTIQAEDGGSPVRSAQSTLAITVTSTVPNNNDPAFSSTTITAGVARDASTGTVVTTALATDLDNGASGEVRHKIESGNTDGYFSIDSQTGVVTTVGSVLLASDAYTLTVVARDNGVPQRSATATVSVAVTPGVTTFSTVDYTFTVTENDPTDTEVGRIDVDTGRTITGGYTIDVGNFASAFKISTNIADSKGVLQINTPPDYEVKSSYSLLIKVGTDIGDVYKVAQVLVTDANDESPVFAQSSYTFTIAENLPAGTSVGTISYADADLDAANRVNTLAVQSPGDTYFSIDQTGQLTLVTSPDFESLSSPLTFDVTATDSQTPPLTATTAVTVNVIDIVEDVTVAISDITDDALISLELPYQSSNGYEIITLTPGDFGIASSPTATVEFVTFQGADPFTIDSSTGTITVTDSTLLTDATKYMRWAVCRSTDGGVVTSQLSLIRIDTFDQDTQMIVIEFSNTLADVNSNLANFRNRAQYFFTGTTRVGFAQTFETGTMQTAVYTYGVLDTSVDSIAGINQAKTFMTEAQLLANLQQSADGTPVSGLSAPPTLTVTSVSPFEEGSSSGDSFFRTPVGIAVICLIAVFSIVLVTLLGTCLVTKSRVAA